MFFTIDQYIGYHFGVLHHGMSLILVVGIQIYLFLL